MEHAERRLEPPGNARDGVVSVPVHLGGVVFVHVQGSELGFRFLVLVEVDGSLLGIIKLDFGNRPFMASSSCIGDVELAREPAQAQASALSIRRGCTPTTVHANECARQRGCTPTRVHQNAPAHGETIAQALALQPPPVLGHELLGELCGRLVVELPLAISLGVRLLLQQPRSGHGGRAI